MVWSRRELSQLSNDTSHSVLDVPGNIPQSVAATGVPVNVAHGAYGECPETPVAQEDSSDDYLEACKKSSLYVSGFRKYNAFRKGRAKSMTPYDFLKKLNFNM